jgi:threonine aldolase
MKRNFYSDNVVGGSPEVVEAVLAACWGDDDPYGGDRITERLRSRFAAVFEKEIDIYPVGTGTAANGISVAATVAPYGALYCSDVAHTYASECGGPEFWSGGGVRVVTVPSRDGKMTSGEVASALESPARRGGAEVPPRAVSVTQATELGTVYALDEMRAIGQAARQRGLYVQMDGARLANAVAHLGCTPAQATWQAGVDILSFGGTKNGALLAEAIVCFEPALMKSLRYRVRRGGHLFSKMRVVSAQLEALLRDDLWLRNARHANAMARRLEGSLSTIPGVRVCHPVEANLVFVQWSGDVLAQLAADGYVFSRRGTLDGQEMTRIVCSFDTPIEAVDALAATVKRHAVSSGRQEERHLC